MLTFVCYRPLDVRFPSREVASGSGGEIAGRRRDRGTLGEGGVNANGGGGNERARFQKV